ncbi:alpha/beta hydrolase family protein [Desulfosoma caldarium]|uniref:Serine aminopeptidase S33 family n=1 Tax=Desulfosoma caldarium TaxID=610254 RepID=A0A3N1UY98_9BACT|nr:alpha/beta fold hydrolase [Desulfosoma caldarium]ROQ93527.1 serine aminopeptidase S33 family [Desulfosoma caldarium]
MRVESLTFTNAFGQKLSGRLDTPSEVTPRAVLLFAHCFTCSKNLSAVVHISRALTEAGYAVFRFDFTGLGESEGDFSQTDFVSHVDDVEASAQFLAQRGLAPHILVGHSLGGAAVVHAAPRVPSCRAVAVIGAPFNPTHVARLLRPHRDTLQRQGAVEIVLGGKTVRVGRGFLEEIPDDEVTRRVAALRRPLLVLHAPEDTVVSVENGERLFHAARHPKSFVALAGADHLLSDKRDARYVGELLAVWAERFIFS